MEGEEEEEQKVGKHGDHSHSQNKGGGKNPNVTFY